MNRSAVVSSIGTSADRLAPYKGVLLLREQIGNTQWALTIKCPEINADPEGTQLTDLKGVAVGRTRNDGDTPMFVTPDDLETFSEIPLIIVSENITPGATIVVYVPIGELNAPEEIGFYFFDNA